MQSVRSWSPHTPFCVKHNAIKSHHKYLTLKSLQVMQQHIALSPISKRQLAMLLSAHSQTARSLATPLAHSLERFSSHVSNLIRAEPRDDIQLVWAGRRAPEAAATSGGAGLAR